jgi:hypothetical protein
MGQGIAFKIVIEIRMGIKMQDVERPMNRIEPGDDGKCHKMIPAKAKRAVTGLGDLCDAGADPLYIVGRLLQIKVPGIAKINVMAKFHAIFGRQIATITPKRGPDDGGRLGRAAQKAAVDVGWQAKKRNCHGDALVVLA